MNSIRSKTMTLTICAVIVSIAIVTLISVLFITEMGNRTSNQLLYLMCQSGEKNLGKSSENPRLFNCRDESVSYPIKLLKKYR
jgi:hypothetical protein